MARRGTLQKIKKIHAQLIPPAGSVPYGLTSDNQQVYTLERPRSGHEPRTDEHGERMWRKHAISGEPLVGLNKPKPWMEHLMFYLESEGNGNVRLVNWAPPTEAEQAAAVRNQKIHEMEESFFAAAVDSGLEPEQVLARIRGEGLRDIMAEDEPEPFVLDEKSDAELDELVAAAGPAEEEVPAEPEKEYPIPYGVGRWIFSNGDKAQMSKEKAFEREKFIKAEMEAAAEAKADAEATPEV